MVRRFALIATGAAALALAIVSAAAARPAASASSAASSVSCSKGVTVGMQAPITGPAASIGSDQLHWAEFYFNQWNKTHKLKIHLKQEDTQLDPSKASTTAQARFAGVRVSPASPAGTSVPRSSRGRWHASS